MPLFSILGLILGVIAVFANSFNPFEPWLLNAYGLFVIQILLGTLVVSKWHGRVARLAHAPDADPSSGEFAAALNDGTAQRVALVQTVLVAVFIFDMVVKPFSNYGVI